MKKFIIILAALAMTFTATACSKADDVTLDNGGKIKEVMADEGKKLAGLEAGNEAVAYTFCYPEEWTMIRNTATIELQLDCNESDRYAEYATVTALTFDLNSDEIHMGAKDYWEKYKSDHEAIFKDFKQLDTKEVKLGDEAAYKVKYTGKINDNKYVSEQIICCKAGSVYLVTLVSPEKYHDDINDVLSVIADSFEFKN